MAGAPDIRPSPAGARLALKVSPGASRDGLRGLMGDRLKVSVRAPPERGRANRAVCELLERSLGLPRGAVEIVAGETASAKTALVRDVAAEDLRERIRRALEDGR